jgi:hypothetical protein
MVCNLGTIAPETRVSFELTVQPTSVGTVTVGATASETENDGHPDDNSTTLNFPVTDFEMTAESSTATVTAGQTATYQLTLTPVNGSYTAPISFKCSGTPQGATCNVNPNSILLSGNSGQTTVTVTTQASNMKSSAKAGSSPMWFLPVSAAILALVWLPGTRQKRALIGVLMVVVLLGTVSCGGGGSTDTGGGNGGGGNGGNNNGTPPGTYTLTVHAVSGTNEKTTKLTLIVQ